MLGDNGIYSVYRVHLHEERGVERRLMGRFALIGGDIHPLEDYDGVLAGIFPAGKLTDRILARMESMERSAYWDIVLDKGDGNPDDLPEMHLGSNPWPAAEPEPEKE